MHQVKRLNSFTFLMPTLIMIILLVGVMSCSTKGSQENSASRPEVGAKDKVSYEEVVETLSGKVLEEAEWALDQEPVTVTHDVCPRSAGSEHDFYSEGDYWWPDPENPNGPYIQRDGMTNPDNFVAHRKSMIRLSRIIGALASAYKITGDEKYVEKAMAHLDAWFVDESTKMNPSLNFAQAIKGRVTGRGIGIIDTIHLMEVAQGLKILKNAQKADKKVVEGTKAWFKDYLQWLTSHQYGKDESTRKNNHATCYFMQVATFASLVGNDSLLDSCMTEFKEVLLPNQMASNGSFPNEINRTKPYGYSIFNLDAMSTLVHVLSTNGQDLWDYQTSNGKSIKKGIAYLYPYLEDKSKWPFQQDVMYWENWPVAQPFMVFGALAYGNREWFELWKSLDHQPQVDEVIRNLPVRNPLIWINRQ